MFLLFLAFNCLDFSFFFFNDTATTEIYTLSLHDALPISQQEQESEGILQSPAYHKRKPQRSDEHESGQDRKSGSAGMPRPISYAVFCLKKKKKKQNKHNKHYKQNRLAQQDMHDRRHKDQH